MKRIVMFALAFGSIGLPALAGNPVFEAPVEPEITAPIIAAPISDWSGPYVGIQAGWGWATLVESGDPDIEGDGYVAGAHAGFNFDFGNWVAGVELDYNKANIEFDAPADADDTIDSLAHLKLRGGFDLGSTLLYGTLGMARATAAGGDSGDGKFAGLGLEHRLTPHVTIGGEFLMHRFEDIYYDGMHLDVSTLQARASFHF